MSKAMNSIIQIQEKTFGEIILATQMKNTKTLQKLDKVLHRALKFSAKAINGF